MDAGLLAVLASGAGVAAGATVTALVSRHRSSAAAPSAGSSDVAPTPPPPAGPTGTTAAVRQSSVSAEPSGPDEASVDPRTADPATAGSSAAGHATAGHPPAGPLTTGVRQSFSDELAMLLTVLPEASIVLESDDRVALCSARAEHMGLVRRGRVVHDELLTVAAAARRSQEVKDVETTVRRVPLRRGLLELRVRAAPLSRELTVLLVQDLTEERRVDAVRRDFVANVSHELKTPVGALTLLAEAVLTAGDEPQAVRRFATRMQVESQRLSNLVNDLIDLSRLQGDDPLSHAALVDVDLVIAEAVDTTRMIADAKQIEIVVGGERGIQVDGVEAQLVMALRNLLSNAVAYSPSGTRVAVASRVARGRVEIAVKDQGMGIPAGEVDRIFERFYRIDPARSRVTGGTGLGLSIVKHVCSSHGGDVVVWSVEGEGSTFTLRLPAVPAAATGSPGPAGLTEPAESAVAHGMTADVPAVPAASARTAGSPQPLDPPRSRRSRPGTAASRLPDGEVVS
ncbi:MAG: two-component sensor histidine kinase [Actinomycetota bacterium]|nr:MAG: two-component sensor histidine kinase [Actinomycetota bacterium]